MKKIKPAKSETKIQKIVERTFNRLKELEQNGRIEILELVDIIKENIYIFRTYKEI